MRLYVLLCLFIPLIASADSWRLEPVTDVSGPSAREALEARYPAAAMAPCDRGLLIAGGLDQKGKPLKRVFILDEEANKIVLPDLPVPIAYAGAAMWSNAYCVAGGVLNPERHHFNYEVYLLSATNQAAGWKSAVQMYAPGRIAPILFKMKDEMFLAGGWMATLDSERKPVYLPLASIWKILPRSVAGPFMDKGQALGNCRVSVKNDNEAILFARPSINEVRDYSAILHRDFDTESKALRLIRTPQK